MRLTHNRSVPVLLVGTRLDLLEPHEQTRFIDDTEAATNRLQLSLKSSYYQQQQQQHSTATPSPTSTDNNGDRTTSPSAASTSLVKMEEFCRRIFKDKFRLSSVSLPTASSSSSSSSTDYYATSSINQLSRTGQSANKLSNKSFF
jgi:hypothetical protein